MHKWLFGNPAKIAKLWQFGYIILTVWPDVHFGSKADIRAAKRHVRFTPKSGHPASNL
jgi:hypothetical protein